MPPIVAPAGPVPLPATGGIEYVSVRPAFAVGYADRRSRSSRCAGSTGPRVSQTGLTQP
ncbi:hypothetical protein ABZ552_21355 [Nocardia sp. NPDC019219]|uniref:hypothetical protein n=1 Tax=Nocardia TaxID=1817 RepID=UPI00248F4CA3|nr:hypothetical protein [Nocardia sputorum]